MKLIIPAAGEGKRLRPQTLTRSKPLLPVAGRTILDYVLEPVMARHPEELIFVIGYLGDQIRDHVDSNYDFNSRFVWQNQLRGLGYAIHLALQSVDSGEVLVLLADTIVDCDLDKFCRAGKNVVGLRKVEDPERFGIAEVEGNRITNLIEKPDDPKSDLAVIGLYYFSDCRKLKEVLADHIKLGRTTKGEIQFTDALQLLIEQGEEITPFEVRGWFDCGKKETLLATNRHLLEKQASTATANSSQLIPPVSIAESSTIVNSQIGPYVSISKSCRIRDSVLTNSIVGRNSSIEESVLNDSLIGQDVRINGIRREVNLGDYSKVGFSD